MPPSAHGSPSSHPGDNGQGRHHSQAAESGLERRLFSEDPAWPFIEMRLPWTEEYQTVQKAVDLIYPYPLRQSAIDTLNRQIKSGIGDESLAQLVCMLYSEDRLCIVEDEQQGKNRQ